MQGYLKDEFIFWAVWLVIPLIIDIITGIGSAIVVLLSYFQKRNEELDYFPQVSILIPVYNREDTIQGCLLSILRQSYPLERLQVIIIDNNSVDNSYEIIRNFQKEHSDLKTWYIKATSKGKALALNKGIYSAEGKYIINIDSDGTLEKDAILRCVEKFESDTSINAFTGAVLINYNEINDTKNLFLKILQKCELFEYNESFMVGRFFQGKTNTMFTMSGAFSAFRRDAIFKTQLYNNATLGEDAHMTFQIREILGGKIDFCQSGFYYTSPIESFNRLYIQRQRWQRGEIEVASTFNNKKNKLGSIILRYIIFKDHTLIFPRLIWFFAMIYLVFIDYPISLLIGINLIMYFAYVINSFAFLIISKLYLSSQIELKKYLNRQWYIIFLLPLYRTMLFVFRLAGIINAAKAEAKWDSQTLTEELMLIKKLFKSKLGFYYKLKKWINSGY